MGGVRWWVTGGTLHPIKDFSGHLVQTKSHFWERYLSEASPADILTAPATLVG